MKTVLFVDDEVPILYAIKRNMKVHRDQIRCLFTCDVDTAIYLVDQVDMVVTDWTMPGGSGRDVVDKCKQMNVPVIVSSGDDLTIDVPHIKKPCIAQIPDAVARALHLLDL